MHTIMTVIKHTLTIALVFALLVFTACKNDDLDPKAAALNEQLNALMNGGSSWVLGSTGSVMKDGVDVSNQFAGFKLTIGSKTYTTQNSLRHVWDSSGTWDFIGDDPDQILTDDGTEISVSLSDSSLILTFNAGSSEAGRANSVSGEYVFRLISE
jgi:hypothetical protein